MLGKRTLNLQQLTQLKEESKNDLADYSDIIKEIIKSMLGYSDIPISIKGTKSQVNLLADVLKAERDFMEAYRDYGPENPRTSRTKINVEIKVDQFERTTGINWPFR